MLSQDRAIKHIQINSFNIINIITIIGLYYSKFILALCILFNF